MAEKSTPPPYVPGGSAMAQAANAEYQKALEDMLSALDARKTRLFDPELLAMSRGFLAPNPSGSFFSALGNVGEEVGKTQLAQEKENRDIAQAKLGLAGQKVGLARQQESDALLSNFLTKKGGFQTPGVAPAAPGAARVAGALGAPSAGPRGYKIAPGQPEFIDPMQYFALSRLMDKDANVGDLLKKADEMQRSRLRTTDKGTFDTQTGEYFPAPGTSMVEVSLAGFPNKTFPVPEIVAVQLSQLYSDALNGGDPAPYQQLAKRIAQGLGPTAAPTTPAATAAPGAGTTTGAAPAPGAVSTFGGMPSKQDVAASAAAQAKLAEGRASTAVKSEEAWPQIEETAGQMLGIANRVSGLTKESSQFIGMLDRPGVANAIGLLLSKKFFNQDGTVDRNAFQTALRSSGIIKNVTENDIANINMIGADLARLELLYAREYLSGTGPITEGERAIAARLGGNLGENPKSLLQKMKLIRLGSQHKLDVGEAWNKYITENENGDWTKFSRGIKRQMDIDFQRRLGREFKVAPAIPSGAKKAGIEKSKEIVNGLIGG